MSDLTERVLAVVRTIPEGRAMTYGDLAQSAGTGARAVGRILHRGGHEIPWWRVVDAGGRPYPAAIAEVRRRMHDERTPLLEDSASGVRVDLAQASWVPHES